MVSIVDQSTNSTFTALDRLADSAFGIDLLTCDYARFVYWFDELERPFFFVLLLFVPDCPEEELPRLELMPVPFPAAPELVVPPEASALPLWPEPLPCAPWRGCMPPEVPAFPVSAGPLPPPALF